MDVRWLGQNQEFKTQQGCTEEKVNAMCSRDCVRTHVIIGSALLLVP